MIDVLKYIFSGFGIFIGTCILLEITLGNIFKLINNYIKLKCIAKLSNDGKSAKEIDELLNKEDDVKGDNKNDEYEGLKLPEIQP